MGRHQDAAESIVPRCDCGQCGFDGDAFLDGQARYFLKNPETTRRIWRNWSNPNHPRYKGKAYMAELRRRIERIKA